jgi:hypothetical protein
MLIFAFLGQQCCGTRLAGLAVYTVTADPARMRTCAGRRHNRELRLGAEQGPSGNTNMGTRVRLAVGGHTIHHFVGGG